METYIDRHIVMIVKVSDVRDDRAGVGELSIRISNREHLGILIRIFPSNFFIYDIVTL
jgi:hypothetical protein